MRAVRLVCALLAVGFWLVTLGAVCAFGRRTKLYSIDPVIRFWHRRVAGAMGIRIRVRGAPTSERPLMLASNHVSLTDIPVLGAVADVSFISKAEVADWPVIGWLADMQRSVYVDRDSRRSSGEQAGAVAQRLAEGDVMVLFAEGTTGDGNLLLPFKSTLFGAAALALADGRNERVVIQPVALAYTRLHGMPMGRQHRPLAAWIGDQAFVPHLLALLAEGATDVEVRFGEPAVFEKGTSRKAIARLMEQRVGVLLRQALSDPLPSAAGHLSSAGKSG